jgi:hypothetical protein
MAAPWRVVADGGGRDWSGTLKTVRRCSLRAADEDAVFRTRPLTRPILCPAPDHLAMSPLHRVNRQLVEAASWRLATELACRGYRQSYCRMPT